MFPFPFARARSFSLYGMRSLLVAVTCATAIAAQHRMPGGYIVELASGSSGKRSDDPHAEFLSELDKRSLGNFETRQEYHHELFTGIAVQLKTPEDLVDIASLPNVVAVHPLWIQPGPAPVAHRFLKDEDGDLELGGNVHKLTGVDVVQATGITGKGVRVAIIDSGVDYNHPALGGGFGPGFKIAGGYDLVGDEYSGDNTPIPDDDPMDCLGHGTHVTGIVGANADNKYKVVGVAPDAEIFMYKVGGCRGGIGDDVITAAILRAADERADVISMSFGSVDGWTNSAIAEVASRAAARGIVVTASAGNSGDAGYIYASTPAVGQGVISVGSVESSVTVKQTFTSNVEHAPFRYTNLVYPAYPDMQVPGVPETPLPVIALKPFPDGTSSWDCQSLPEDYPKDLTGYAVVLYNSDNMDCPAVEFTVALNPTIILNYKVTWLLSNTNYASVWISDEDGFWLAEQAQSGNLTITFPGPLQQQPNDGAGLMNDFSSKGPGNRLEFYPQLSAPGGDILSTYVNGQWVSMSGTSMSNPYAAGSAALLLQAKGKKAARSIGSLLQTTSQSLPSSRAAGSLPDTLASQGAGLVNLISAISTKTRISPSEILLNDTAYWKKTHTITIFNDGRKAQTYKLAHVPAGTTSTKAADTADLSLSPVGLVSAPVKVRFSQGTVRVAAGKSAKVVVTIAAPSNADARTLPLVSGWITATSNSGESVKTSYLGLAAPFGKAQTISTTNRYNNNGVPLPAIFGETSFQRGPENYTIRDPSVWPTLYFGLATPSARVLIDLVAADAAITSNVPHAGNKKREWTDWLPERPGALRVASAPGKAYPIIGPVGQFNWLPRNAYARQDSYKIELRNFANGTHFPLGQYRALIRALRPLGKVDKAADYDVYVSEQFGWVE